VGLQKFHAGEPFEFSNGAIGWRPGGEFDCLGPFAKVQNCPVRGARGGKRVTAYARNYADTFFSVPAICLLDGEPCQGFFAMDDGAIEFYPYDYERDKRPHLFTSEDPIL
jgi:hypothetical protein